MTNMHRTIQIAILCAALAISTVAHSQTQRDQNTRALKPYMTSRVISTLEWELLQFNLLWQGSYVGAINYVTSYPVVFDPKTMRFRATFAVQEKREYNDPESLFKLPRVQRESIFQGPIDQLTELLGQSFPEIKSNRSLIYVEFWFRSSGGGRSVIAKYENGLLSLTE